MDGIPKMKRLQGPDWLSQLAEDVLWTILGFLDLATLCTARLVCKSFRKSAAGHFKALDCTTLEEVPTTDFTQFSSMTHLAVTLTHASHLQSLAHPRIAPVVTHVSLKGVHLQNRETAEEIEAVLMWLPKLRSLSLQPLVGHSCLPLFPPALEQLQITHRPSCSIHWYEQWRGLGDASPLTRYSQLTSLAIDLVGEAGTSLGSLSSLRNLRSLDLRSSSAVLGPLSTITALTSLTFTQRYSREVRSVFQDLGRLTGLSRLALSMESVLEIMRDVELACIAKLTKLTCLDMSGCRVAGTVASSTALLALTRLVSVQFINYSVRLPQLSLPQLGALQSLGLGSVSDISILGRATGLTHLELSCEIQEWEIASLQGLRPAVAGVSRLRSLDISVCVDHLFSEYGDPFGEFGDPFGEYGEYYPFGEYGDDENWPEFYLDGVLRACTMLTKLAYRGELRPDADLEACAALTGLRSLTFAWTSELKPAWLPALQAMSGLTELSLMHTGVHAASMTPDVIAAFDADRRQLGWPLLKLRVETHSGGRFERLGR